MRAIWLIARRELGSIVKSPVGFIIAALYLAVVGLHFNLGVLGGEEKFSADVLAGFFYLLSGYTMFFSVFVSMRLIARERETGTIPLLLTSPIRDSQLILGKFLGAFLFLTILTLLTLYMPLMIMVNGKISWGQVIAGYLGILLLGASCLAIGAFGSSLTKHQIVAIFVTLGIGAPLVLFWMLGRLADRPLNDIFAQLALHNIHFASFKEGQVHLRDIVYYLSVTSFFLFAATRMLESRRWR
jgi:ABC-2 type transport system permease protein